MTYINTKRFLIDLTGDALVEFILLNNNYNFDPDFLAFQWLLSQCHSLNLHAFKSVTIEFYSRLEPHHVSPFDFESF